MAFVRELLQEFSPAAFWPQVFGLNFAYKAGSGFFATIFKGDSYESNLIDFSYVRFRIRR